MSVLFCDCIQDRIFLQVKFSETSAFPGEISKCQILHHNQEALNGELFAIMDLFSDYKNLSRTYAILQPQYITLQLLNLCELQLLGTFFW